MNTSENFVLGYRPALDGLRGVAILAVLAVHTSHLFGWSMLKGGSIGVDIFFVLSGFLITSILLNEWNNKGSISLRKFYLRRCLRLVPALLLLVVVVHLTANFLLSPEEAAQTRFATPFALVYATDFVIAFAPNIQLGALKHTWSLAMEEQFYLLWPPLLILLLKLEPRRDNFSCSLCYWHYFRRFTDRSFTRREHQQELIMEWMLGLILCYWDALSESH